MPLINLKTELKSLKYGQDTPGGGNSGQPYIKTDINNVDKGFNQLRLTKFDDGLIRGGAVGALNASVVDTLRIGKFLTDLPKGPLFLIKQVGLQLSNPRIETKQISIGKGTGILGFVTKVANTISNNFGPTRIYNLGLNTIAQIPLTAFGQHLNRHGLTPIQDENTKYFAVVKDNNEKGTNRLIGLKNTLIGININQQPTSTIQKTFTSLVNIASSFGAAIPLKPLLPTQLNIADYAGGPGSLYGIGRTTIKRYDFTGIKDKNKINFVDEINLNNKIDLNIKQGLNENGPSLKYPSASIDTSNASLNQNVINYGSPSTKTYQKIYSEVENLKNYKHLTPSSIPYKFFKENLSDDEKQLAKEKPFINKPNLNIGKGDKENPFKYNESLKTAFNRIDAKILQIAFRIITSNNPNGNNADQINLSAYMNGFKDNFNATWNEVNYNGRSDSFYIYNKGKRDVSFNLQIPCFNQKQLFEKHRALGQLASVTAGTYNNGFLQGVLIKLNVGNYIVGEYAKLDSISYSIPENATWDKDNKLAMYIEASFNFTIIHKDLPQYQKEEGFFKYLHNPLPKGIYLEKTQDEDGNGTKETLNEAAKRFAADY